MAGIWQDLMTMGVPIADKVARTVAVYAFLVAGLRLFGKRELGQLNPLDLVVLLLLANTVQNAIIGPDHSLVGGLLGAAVLFTINGVIVRLAYRNPRFRRLVEGRPELLVHDGRVIAHALDSNSISREELLTAAREQGVQDIHDLESARLEVSGALSFTLRDTMTSERFRREVLERLSAIERRLPAAVALLLAASLAAPQPAFAQARPSTDVWVVPMKQHGTSVRFGEPANLTKRTGYDNQPSFTADGKAVLYTVIGDDAQADIWRVPLPAGKPQRVTTTAESEYSAAVTPDRRSFSVIRVEADSAQRLWRFPLDGSGAPSVVLEKIKPVGYHVWAGDHRLVIFVLGSPATLQLADARTGTSEVVASNIGRALGKVPGRDAVTYQQMVPGGGSWIGELDVRTKQVRRLVKPPPGADYHVWTPGGELLAAAGSRVYQLVNGRWDEVADFSRLGVRGITRLAVSPKGDRLAFVAEDTAPR